MNDNTRSDAAALPVPEGPQPDGLWQRLGRLWAAIFGVWAAPPWLRWIGEQLQRGASTGAVALRAHPRASAFTALALVLIGVGSYFGHAWWQARPQPVEVSFNVSGPALTDFANNGAPRAVSVKFSKSVAPLALVGKDVTAGISVMPAVEGTWRWASDRQLDFTPKAEWPVGAQYKVVIDRGAIAPQIRLENDEFGFASAAFQPTIRKAEFYQDPVNPAIKKAVIELGFTHPVNTIELEKRIGRQGTLYWFADSAYVGSVSAGKDLVWQPPAAGRYTLSAVDAHGAADTRDVSVEFAP